MSLAGRYVTGTESRTRDGCLSGGRTARAFGSCPAAGVRGWRRGRCRSGSRAGSTQVYTATGRAAVAW